MPKSNRKRPKFKGNRFTSKPSSEHIEGNNPGNFPHPTCSTSAKKLNLSTLENQTVDTETNYEHDYNVIVNFSILQTIITKYSSCPECKNTLSLNNNLKRKRGLCLLFELTCIHCDWKNEFETSFEIAVDSALLEFNDGATGLYGVLKGCGIKYGRFMDLATKRKDGIRVRNMELKSSKA